MINNNNVVGSLLQFMAGSKPDLDFRVGLLSLNKRWLELKVPKDMCQEL